MVRPPVGPARGVLRGPARGARPSRHRRLAPSAALAEWIAHFWTVSWDLREQPPVRAETLPHPSVHVVFEGGRAKIAGTVTGKFSRLLSGRGVVFGIKFRPAAFHPLYGAPLSRLTDRVVGVGAVFGAAGEALARAIGAEPRFHARARLAEAFLAARLAPRPPAPVRRARDLTERMAADRDLVRVEQVAALAGMDARGLQRLFRTYVGVTPKWVIGRYRLHEAAARLAGGGGNLAELAAALGYFDQAHFIRDFKDVVGETPGRYARRTVVRPRVS